MDEDLLKAQYMAPGPTQPLIRMRCPHCRHQGTFEPFPVQDTYNNLGPPDRRYFVGRRCPGPSCHGIVFVVCTAEGEILQSFPPERVDFDSSALPPTVLATLEEAVACLAASCFRAAAMMVRRTLEVVCDQQEARGGDLKARIQALGKKAIVPEPLLTGLDNLRLLGNDAAHVEARTYQDIGEPEVVLALDVTKELLKAVYQYTDLVARLDAMKGSADPPQ